MEQSSTGIKGIDRLICNLSFMIVTHYSTTGPADALREYLIRHGTSYLVFVGHPFYHRKGYPSFALFYKDGRVVHTLMGLRLNGPDVLLYIKDFIFTILVALKAKTSFGVYVGVDPLNALAGLILRTLGLARKVVFYTIDYVPTRFGNRLLNGIYHSIDKFCAENCDQVWNLSYRMSIARKLRGVKGKQIVVPMGGNFNGDLIKRRPFQRTTMVYLGDLRRGQGLELVLDSIPLVVKAVPTAKLKIIGTGPLESKLKAKVYELGIQNHVEFLGYIPDHSVVESILRNSAFGLACYEPLKESFTWFADPGKPKQYLACGLPVIITKVPSIAAEIEREGAGLIIEYEKENFVSAAIALLTRDDLLRRCKLGAIKLGQKYSWENIFTSALLALVRFREPSRTHFKSIVAHR